MTCPTQVRLHEIFNQRREDIFRGKATYRRGGRKNALKTHCAKGHEFTLSNTHYVTAGENIARQCKACKENYNRERRNLPPLK